ncbi:MAG: hypothetical protein COB09_10595 [Thalassobium sp.]|nr:MAG: hypothetical protein COB09_10595 [Thalassobium sp.]
MRPDKQSHQILNSNARLSLINVFVPAEVDLDDTEAGTTARFRPYRYTDLSLQLSPVNDGVIHQFPIILRGDGTPWDLGNLYLIRKFTEMAKLAPPSVATFKKIAQHLMMYLRWIEHLKNEGNEIHELHFPEAEERRVTWAYYRYLRRLLRQPEQPISLRVVKMRMQAVVNFYRGLDQWELVESGDIENVPFQESLSGIPVVNAVGLQLIKTVKTTNFTFRVPHRETIGTIRDGGTLRPLDDEEQKILLDHLEQQKNRVFQLMCIISLFTGARIQTVCTLRLKDIQQLSNQQPRHGEVLLKVGAGTGIDTKNQKNYRLHLPAMLVQALHDYTHSAEAKKRRQKSFYGENELNYVFLTSNGSPYYTSTAEIADRQNSEFSQRVSAKDRVKFTIQEGNSVRNYLARLIDDIRKHDPDFTPFRFHDLRATFGMNFVRDADAAGIRDVRNQLKARMGHSSFETTQRYLNFNENNNIVRLASDFHHSRLNRFIGGLINK